MITLVGVGDHDGDACVVRKLVGRSAQRTTEELPLNRRIAKGPVGKEKWH